MFKVMHILIENFSQVVVDRAYIAIDNRYKIAHGFSIDINAFELGE